jgi:hypothetical protein
MSSYSIFQRRYLEREKDGVSIINHIERVMTFILELHSEITFCKPNKLPNSCKNNHQLPVNK